MHVKLFSQNAIFMRMAVLHASKSLGACSRQVCLLRYLLKYANLNIRPLLTTRLYDFVLSLELRGEVKLKLIGEVLSYYWYLKLDSNYRAKFAALCFFILYFLSSGRPISPIIFHRSGAAGPTSISLL